jgi:hypothetical protein
VTYRHSAPRPPLPAPERGAYAHLERIARALEAPYLGAARLDAYYRSFRVTIDLELNSGNVCGMSIHVACGPFPDVLLRKELDSDSAGKERGIAREVQTGDALFDGQIYIESDAFDDAVKQVLLHPATRGALLALVVGRQTVTFDQRGILLKVGADDKADGDDFDPARILPMLESLSIVADTPSVADSGKRKERRGVLVPILTASIGTPLGILCCVLAFHSYDPVKLWPSIAGVVLLLALWLAARPIVARIVAGDSRSFGRYRLTVGLLFVNAVLWGVGLPLFLNGALDGQTSTVIHGVVANAHYDSEEDHTSIDARWANGETSSHTLSGNVNDGAPLTTQRHPGAFGVPWLEHGRTTSP